MPTNWSESGGEGVIVPIEIVNNTTNGVHILQLNGSALAEDGIVHSLAQCYDRAWVVDRAGFETPLTIEAGIAPAVAIARVVDESLNISVPRTIVTGGGEPVARATWTTDPWSNAVWEYAQGGGLDVRFGPSGNLIATPIDDTHTITKTLDGTNALIEVTGEERGSDWGNGVTVIGTSPHLLFGVRATVWDDDPASDTYYLGPTGRHLLTRENSTIFSTAAAETAARAELAKLAGGSVAVSWTQVPDPTLDAFDVIGLTYPGLGITDRVVVDEVTIPLRPGPVTVAGRTV